jgi:hypothetical protein
MAKTGSRISKYVDGAIWKKEFFQELPSLARDLYWWLITNEYISNMGIIDFNIKIIKLETGLNQDEIERALKILKDNFLVAIYKKENFNLIYVKNYQMHQNGAKSPTFQQNVVEEAQKCDKNLLSFLEEEGLDLSKYEAGKARLEYKERKSLIGSLPAPDEQVLLIHNVFREIDSTNPKKPHEKEAMSISEVIRKYSFDVVKEVAFYCRDAYKGIIMVKNIKEIPKNSYFFAMNFDKIYKMFGGVDMSNQILKSKQAQNQKVNVDFDPLVDFDYGDQ